MDCLFCSRLAKRRKYYKLAERLLIFHKKDVDHVSCLCAGPPIFVGKNDPELILAHFLNECDYEHIEIYKVLRTLEATGRIGNGY